MEQIPILAAVPEQRKAAERWADRVLTPKARNASDGVSAWEREIDRLVHVLYRLPREEMNIVEGRAK